MRKYLLYIAIAGVVAAFFSSCSKTGILDPKSTTDLNNETVFADSSRTIDFLFNLYADAGYTFSWRRFSNTASLAEGSDEAHGSYNGPTIVYVMVLNGSLNAQSTSPYADAWTTAYERIRSANVYLANVDKSPISAALKAQSKAEARCLRAWYYSVLLKNFGGVPLLGDKVFGAADVIDVPRNSYDECVKYIVSELDAASQVLPVNYTAAIDYGRVTKGVCLAIKSRVLLFAASPLFNGGNIGKTPEQRRVVGYESYDANRWQLAADAAKAVMDLNVYSLYEDNVTAPGYGFSKVFLMRKNSEYIFSGMQALNKLLETNFAPRTRSTFSATPRAVPSQNLAEAFGMRNGKAITDQTSGYDDKNPFVNRDPRFNYTFIYNGSLWYLGSAASKQPVYTYVGAPTDGYGQIVYSTGYFWRKMMDENTSGSSGANTERCLPLIRYAEILMNYAEAKNELGDVSAAYDQIKIIRKRAGILPGADGLYGLKPNMTQAEMRQQIYNEKMVEFAWEDHRYFDVRRWKIATQTQNVVLKAMKITRVNASSYTYEVVPVNANSQHIFNEANYFFPIMQSEISKVPQLIQNPGY
ncbi:RagB/SusD family nutrient uptake outer membrane protein [Mucilaginibacter sp. PAMB04274]|uniref:RagB/SusD family nutrient uptake outer membrane protein n=1 Tax=Mucilaginibacter sp. PAMB04274 TaxID=3138568 RepID=UPI0031F66F70